MLRITHGEIDGQAVVTQHTTNACEIVDGCLIVFADPQGTRTLAGYAPGSWAEFEIITDG
ncbi:hypothetical protein [Corynebacterium flavescens]|uniref:hypothetical protein n=1 Tax=Corynebacterium flavescens TaxID=28028 RepID=UPI0028A0CEB1|nr:hypothetical protein [Corynebacterium flavescens]